VVFVRTDARTFTLEATKKALKRAFPRKKLLVRRQPLSGQSQTALFGDTGKKPGEVDLIML